MSINLHLPTHRETLKPRITVVGVGGAGGNAVNNMISSSLEGVEFVMANTDAQALEGALTDRVVQLGASVTRGLGAGASPDVGRAAAEEAEDELASYIEGANMVFITAGMGGGTGTGAAPVIARLAKEHGILTVGVVTKPFHFEGTHRMRIADAGIDELQQYVDTLIVIPNQNLFRIANEKTTFAEAFRMADEVLHSGVRGVTDLMVKPGLVNLDFADIRAVMSEMGKAMMGTGEASSDRRAIEAAEAAISNPLLDDVSLKGARAVLINITGGPDMTLYEVDEAANRIRDEVDPEANIIFGSTFSDAMAGKMRVSVVATGIDAAEAQQRAPQAAPQMRQAPRPISVGSGLSPLRRETPVQAQAQAVASAPTESRSAADIVRHAPAPSLSEMARIAASKLAHQQSSVHVQAPPVVRIVDEALTTQVGSAQPVVDRVGAAVRMAAGAAANHAPHMQEDAGPLFVSPRAEQPVQRTLYQAEQLLEQEETYYVEEEVMEEEAAPVQGGLFSKLRGALSSKSEQIKEVKLERSEARKAEVRETRPSGGEDEEYYDIPAFLRRQAN